MASEVSKHDTIEIEKTQFWPSPREGCRVNALIMDYTSAKGRRLFGTCVEEDVELLEKTAGIGEARTGLMYSDAHGQSLRLDEPPFSVTRQTDDGLVLCDENDGLFHSVLPLRPRIEPNDQSA